MPKKQKSTEIMSIFGQIEAAVSDSMIREGKITRIECADIPASAYYNDAKVPARFAIIVPPEYVAEFNRRVKELRS